VFLACRLGVAAVTQELTSVQGKPMLDEGSFQQLLAAAYVVQAHNDRLATKKRQSDATHSLSEIAETQRLIQTQQLDLQASTELIAERVQKITNASGVAVGIVEQDQLVYCAGTGSAACEAGSRVPLNSTLSADCLRNGKILQCSNEKDDSHERAELCRERGIKSLIALPVYHAGKVSGVLELRFAKANSFQEHDLRTSQLMAGLIAEALARSAELARKQALASERANVLAALESIKPQLERLVSEPGAAPAEPGAPLEKAPAVEPTAVSDSGLRKRESPAAICVGCGHQMEEGESFCGICGTARVGKSSSADIQSKWASLWHLQQAAGRREAGRGEKESFEREPDDGSHGSNQTALYLPTALEAIAAAGFSDEEEQDERESSAAVESRTGRANAASSPSLDEILARFSATEASPPVDEPDVTTKDEADVATQAQAKASSGIIPAETSEPSEADQTSVWTSAMKAREWLELLKTTRPSQGRWVQLWRRHRANVYLGIAVLVLQLVILVLLFSGRETRSVQGGNSPVSGNGASAVKARQRKSPPQPDLTLFERLLVSLGLAEPPPVPVYAGNPGTRVWVDLHTALYYCPGSDLYGKTPGGKFTTQRDAQQDQFEPAHRKACN
jgi:hypothetical protein